MRDNEPEIFLHLTQAVRKKRKTTAGRSSAVFSSARISKKANPHLKTGHSLLIIIVCIFLFVKAIWGKYNRTYIM